MCRHSVRPYEQAGVALALSYDSESRALVDDGKDRCRITHDGVSGEVFVDAAPEDMGAALEVALEAKLRAENREAGEPTWWSIGFASPASVGPAGRLHMFQSMLDGRRWGGTWRLGADALIRFTPKETGSSIFLEHHITVTFRSAGPGYGPFCQQLAQEWAELIRSMLAFAIRGPLEGGIVFPADDSERTEAQQAVANPAIPELAPDGVSLWPVLFAVLADASPDDASSHELALRTKGALRAYEYALTQDAAGAVFIFSVSAIEALAVPNVGKFADEGRRPPRSLRTTPSDDGGLA